MTVARKIKRALKEFNDFWKGFHCNGPKVAEAVALLEGLQLAADQQWPKVILEAYYVVPSKSTQMGNNNWQIEHPADDFRKAFTETFLLSHQVQKIAAATSHLDYSMNHVNQRDITMKMRKLMMTMDAILDYDRPKPNPRHDDKGKPGGG
ncbi:hypothetical protein SAY87_010104 [Trapa incisa]|uniref:Uncharacterized protein n=1 Tax=Trapa incisa TaxID=236973 RepID=A0AAN7GQ14_9MYRT|nr:hypothetical protein SAY87_010104 [Trapa incisa]